MDQSNELRQANAVADTNVFLVEVLDVGRSRSPAQRKLDSAGSELVSGESTRALAQISSIDANELKQGITSICATVTSAIESIAPDTCSVELNIGFKAGVKIPVLMSGEANAALKVTLGWKKTLVG